MKTERILEAVMKMANLKDLKQADEAAPASDFLTKLIIGEELVSKIADVSPLDRREGWIYQAHKWMTLSAMAPFRTGKFRKRYSNLRNISSTNNKYGGKLKMVSPEILKVLSLFSGVSQAEWAGIAKLVGRTYESGSGIFTIGGSARMYIC